MVTSYAYLILINHINLIRRWAMYETNHESNFSRQNPIDLAVNVYNIAVMIFRIQTLERQH